MISVPELDQGSEFTHSHFRRTSGFHPVFLDGWMASKFESPIPSPPPIFIFFYFLFPFARYLPGVSFDYRCRVGALTVPRSESQYAPLLDTMIK
ncbi:uncharacterized protein BO87DRAFT_68858 [Aspergillus neoniger CBS 115656]|uniref:Uncharacterized protein n=1 Tax=Aspergillus neoniger (strain CBS 115656) TaxID=1448310 RepID=A0A318YG38_ASPNB|nr:hypothetical protein BO87DRAFT_68858 [Aspergillus neoniger CBS 115656]PYH33451.1 hypothetical protein BO87DRAFT_68858 [Aspergillus neoniger CBS 115656]